VGEKRRRMEAGGGKCSLSNGTPAESIKPPYLDKFWEGEVEQWPWRYW